MDLPEVALQWFLCNAVSSDVDLAVVTNVCQEWRRITQKILRDNPDKLPALLLTGMVIENVRRIRRQNSSSSDQIGDASMNTQTQERLPESKTSHKLSNSYSVDDNVSPRQKKPRSDDVSASASCRTDKSEGDTADVHGNPTVSESFCAVWLPPEGVEEVKVALSPVDDIFPTSDQSQTIPSNTTANRRIHLLDQERHAFVVCCESWRGYSRPFEVLRHFGYTKVFVLEVFDQVEPLGRHFESGAATFAVRGATVARPESYCLCNTDPSRSKEPVEYDESDEVETIRRQLERQEAFNMKLQERYDLQRDVLPRVIETKPVDANGLRRRCIRFLNGSAGHAVCMMTPYFDCGSLPLPITIMIVGIATEDGCFMSGLHRRVEVGHLYPENSMIENTELSPVCIATEATTSAPSTRQRAYQSAETPPVSIDSDQESQEFRCQCVFNGVTEKLVDSSETEPENLNLTRGLSGPGRWHCYTFIISECGNRIKIDGIEEPVKVNSAGNQSCGPVELDGLTIGSDHSFDLSLCCGPSSDGDGEGAIAELAVFRGRLPDKDLEALERQLMHKFGIEQPAVPTWEDTDLERQAQALYTDQNAPYWQTSVPLQYMTRHRAVSWHYCSPVNGKRIEKKRIGCRPGAESSDWDD